MTELKAKSRDQLQQELLELRREQLNLRLQSGMGEAPKPHQFKQVKRRIAQVKTILNEVDQD